MVVRTRNTSDCTGVAAGGSEGEVRGPDGVLVSEIQEQSVGSHGGSDRVEPDPGTCRRLRVRRAPLGMDVQVGEVAGP